MIKIECCSQNTHKCTKPASYTYITHISHNISETFIYIGHLLFCYIFVEQCWYIFILDSLQCVCVCVCTFALCCIWNVCVCIGMWIFFLMYLAKGCVCVRLNKYFSTQSTQSTIASSPSPSHPHHTTPG